MSPLHSAVIHRSIRRARLILDYGGRINAQNKAGITPLIAAIMSAPEVRL
jgi:ankyrin repeat protein